VNAINRPLRGVKVVEVAQWWFVPSGAALLAEWGADVIKVEQPGVGDPMRGLASPVPSERGPDVLLGQPYHSKRSVGIDLSTAEGRDLLYGLVQDADVFVTSYLPPQRQKLGIDVEHIRAANPQVIYARGSGQGVRGPDAEKGGYDAVSFWARGGIAHALTEPGAAHPTRMRGAMGDSLGGLGLAGGVAAALFARGRGEPPAVVDVSLLSIATWMQSQEIALTSTHPNGLPHLDRADAANPLTNVYRTSDNRWIMLCMLQPARFWRDFCLAAGRPDLADDERFATAELIRANTTDAVAALDSTFASAPADTWKRRLADITGVWSLVQTPLEVLADPQVHANAMAVPVTDDEDSPARLVASPVTFDETHPDTLPLAPALGAHTDEVLLAYGHDWERLLDLKIRGVIT
jgi:crotonobetainyl-CoA:carnitine CoA-transferase CaiB-like acyl-CoA transferase